MPQLAFVKAEQAARGDGCPKRTEGRRWMPAMCKVPGVDQPAKAGLGVKADHIGGDDVGPGGVRDLARREQRRQQRHSGVTDHRLVHVVVIERMAGRAIGHRCAGR